MGFLLRKSLAAAAAAAVVVGVLAATAAAANPHLAVGSPTLAAPTVTAPDTIAWNGSLVVPFQVSGLGKNGSATVSLVANSLIVVKHARMDGDLTLSQEFVPPGKGEIEVFDTVAGQVTLDQEETTATTTVTGNGTAFGTLTIPSELDASGIDHGCFQVTYTGITLTVGNAAPVSLPDVAQTYDPTGTACASTT